MTGATIIEALVAANVKLGTDEVRIEFDGDDQTPQMVSAVDKRIDEDGNEFYCLVVENT